MSSDKSELANRLEALDAEWKAMIEQRRLLKGKWRKLYQTVDDLSLVGAYAGIGLAVLLLACYLLERFAHGFY